MKPAPPPIVTARHFTSSSSSSTRTTADGMVNTNQKMPTKRILYCLINAKSISQTVSTTSHNSSSTTQNSISGKKKYAANSLQAPGSPSRSRSATKELIRKCSMPKFEYIHNILYNFIYISVYYKM